MYAQWVSALPKDLHYRKEIDNECQRIEQISIDNTMHNRPTDKLTDCYPYGRVEIVKNKRLAAIVWSSFSFINSRKFHEPAPKHDFRRSFTLKMLSNRTIPRLNYCPGYYQLTKNTYNVAGLLPVLLNAALLSIEGLLVHKVTKTRSDCGNHKFALDKLWQKR